MSFFDCHKCDQCVDRSDDTIVCRYSCGREWCSKDCAKTEGATTVNDYTCNECRHDKLITDKRLFEFLLRYFKITKNDAIELYITKP